MKNKSESLDITDLKIREIIKLRGEQLMEDFTIDPSSYIDSLKIRERIDLYELNGIYNMDYDEYQKWVNIRGLINESDVKTKLNLEELTGEQFNNGLKKLTEDEKKLIGQQIEMNGWFKEYKEIFAMYQTVSDKGLFEEKTIDLAVAVSPFLYFINNKLTYLKEGLHNVKISDKVIEAIVTKTATVLMGLMIKTLVWDYRSSTANKVADKEGADGYDILLKRYLMETFNNAMSTEKFFARYPVCARRVTTKTLELFQHFSETLTRLNDNYEEICAEIGLVNCKELVSVDCEQGDCHQQGRFVIRMNFNHGVAIYKPRNLLVEKKFFDAVDKFSREHGLLDLYKNRYFLAPEFTFEQFVEYESCESETEIADYYIRFGQLCAFVYIFMGNDVHFENIIAHKGYPAIIDMETLFQHQMNIIEMGETAFMKVYQDSINSIEGTALLPIISFRGGKENKGIDISALNGRGAELPYDVLQLVDYKTDNIRFDYARISVEDKSNVPLLHGEKVDFTKYTSYIVDGFQRTLNVICNNKDEFIGTNGILDSFRGLKVRQLMRPTNAYAKLMSFSSHPNYATDMLMLERLFNNMWNYPFKDKRVITAEVEDMIDGDVPIFFEIVDDRTLITSRGECIPDYYEETGFDKVSRYISNMDQLEIDKQVSHVKVSLGLFETENRNKEKDMNQDKEILSIAVLEHNHSLLIDAINQIGECVVKTAVVDEGTHTIDWANVMFDKKNNNWKIASITQNFYMGSSGLLEFLIRLGRQDGGYDLAARFIASSFIESPLVYMDIGLKEGIAGVLYGFTRAYKLTGLGMYQSIAQKMVKEISIRFAKAEDCSFADGLLGVINALLLANSVMKNCSFISTIEAVFQRFYALQRTHTTEIKREAGYVLDKLKQVSKLSEIENYIKENEGITGYTEIELFQNIFQLDNLEKDELRAMDNIENGFAGYLLLALLKGNRDEATKIANHLMNHKNGAGYQYATLPGFPTIGFANGLVGIGFSLLSLLEGMDCVPLITV